MVASFFAIAHPVQPDRHCERCEAIQRNESVADRSRASDKVWIASSLRSSQ
jgi:hypothetical protein